MTLADRLWASCLAALLGWALGGALRVPTWENWPIGDPVYLAMISACLVFHLTKGCKR